MSIRIPVHLRIKGHFLLEAINADTGEKRVVAEFDNLIVNQGLDMIGSPPANNAGIAACCIVGTGTTPEAATDTVIESYLAGTKTMASTNSYTFQTTTAPYYTTSTSTYQFPTGAAAGNLTEIGIGFIATTGTNSNPNSGTPLFSHTLIRSGGVPVTITILSNEILNVIYTVQLFVPSTDFTGTFSLNIDGTPTTFNYDIRPCGVSGGIGGLWLWYYPGWTIHYAGVTGGNWFAVYQNSTWAFSSITSTPSGTGAGSASGSDGTYTTGTYTKQFTYSMPVASGNYASGLGGFTVNSTPCYWQIGITPAIMKTNLQVLTIIFAISWSN